MLETQDACKILGVSEKATKNDIERRYSILLKKRRMSVSQGEDDEKERSSFEEITQAYNFLMGYEEPKPVEDNRKPNPLFKKLGIDEKKANNFFYYYKFHILIGIVVLLVLVFTVKSCVTRVNPDFSTAFIGQIDFTNTDKLASEIKAGVPEIKVPGFDGAYITADGSGSQDYVMLEKATVLFAASNTDLYILDKSNFEKYAKQGAFKSLDDISGSLEVDMDKNKDNVIKSEYDTGSHLYGIDISSSTALKNGGILGNDMVVAISVSCKQQDKAVKMIRFLMK